jgi:hypothetical protein
LYLSIELMSIPDLTTIIINLSNSLVSVIYLLKGLAYIIGLFFIYVAISRFKKIAERHAQYPSSERGLVPMAYLFVGAMLILMPETINVLSVTAFGEHNILAYTEPRNPNTLYDAIAILIKTAGFIWVVRGSVLIATGSQPGVQQGSKGVAFLFAGICALNIEASMSVINNILDKLFHLFTGGSKA